jgi:hypothetical protein
VLEKNDGKGEGGMCQEKNTLMREKEKENMP